MRISLDTETEEIVELRHAIAILGDAIKRREAPEEETEEEVQEEIPEEETQEEIPEMPEPKVQKLPETMPEPQVQQKMPEPQVQQRPVPQRPQPARYDPKTDILSKFASSDYGNRVENRTMSGEKGKSSGSPQRPSSPSYSSPSSSMPARDNKGIVKNVIETLKMRSGGNPIMMQDIIKLSRDKNVREDETRNLVNELQRSGAI